MTDGTTSYEPSLDERVSALASDKDAINAFIDEFTPFITSCAYHFGSLNPKIESEELLSAAYIAFYEAVGAYDISKGHFLPFASTVIRCRLVDLARRESRLDTYQLAVGVQGESGSGESVAAIQSAIKLFNSDVQHEMLKYELDSFKRALEEWGIKLEDLLREAPKHRTLIQLYRQITQAVLSDKDILNTVLEKKYFPVKKISELTKTPQKKIERARKYIVASIIVAAGSYDYLSEYISEL